MFGMPKLPTPTADDLPDAKQRGLEDRYLVERRNDPDGKHDFCRYFVLDPQHDPLARVALDAYRTAAFHAGYRQLADDLILWLQQCATPEPTQILSVVETLDGRRYWRWAAGTMATSSPWREMGAVHVDQDRTDEGGSESFRWDELGEVKIISEGVA